MLRLCLNPVEKIIVLVLDIMNQLSSLMVINIVAISVTCVVGVCFDIMTEVFIHLIMVTIMVTTPVRISLVVSIMVLLVMVSVMGLFLMSLLVQVLAMMIIKVSILVVRLQIKMRDIMGLSYVSESVFVNDRNLMMLRIRSFVLSIFRLVGMLTVVNRSMILIHDIHMEIWIIVVDSLSDNRFFVMDRLLDDGFFVVDSLLEDRSMLFVNDIQLFIVWLIFFVMDHVSNLVLFIVGLCSFIRDLMLFILGLIISIFILVMGIVNILWLLVSEIHTQLVLVVGMFWLVNEWFFVNNRNLVYNWFENSRSFVHQMGFLVNHLMRLMTFLVEG